MEITQTAYGTWSGGRFMHFGETLPEDRFLGCIKTAYEAGIRTFVTSDVYGNGKAASPFTPSQTSSPVCSLHQMKKQIPSFRNPCWEIETKEPDLNVNFSGNAITGSLPV